MIIDYDKSLQETQISEYLSEKTIMGGWELNAPTGIPIVYELDKNLKYTTPMRFLGNQVTLGTAVEAVADQYKAWKLRDQEDH